MERPVNLPPEVAAIEKQIEQRTGLAVFWRSRMRLDGAMCARWICGRPVVLYKEYSNEGAAEELLHLRLDCDGYRHLRPLDHNGHTHQALTMLMGIAQHRMIFPRLRAHGSNPDDGECEAVCCQIEKIIGGGFDASRLAAEPKLEALLSVVYARALAHCQRGRSKNLANSAFSGDSYSNVRSRGQAIAGILDLTADTSPEEYERALERCLKLIGLRDCAEFVDVGCSTQD